MTGPDHPFRLQNLAEALGQARRAKNFTEKKKGAARIRFLCNREKRALELRVRGELVSSGVEPGVYRGVCHTKLGLQFARKALRIVDQKARINTEEACQQFARGIRQMGPGAIFDLRKVSLAEPTAEFLLHGLHNFGLRHGAAKTAERPFDGA